MFSHYELKFTKITNVDKTYTINFYPEATESARMDQELKAKMREMRTKGFRVTSEKSIYTEE